MSSMTKLFKKDLMAGGSHIAYITAIPRIQEAAFRKQVDEFIAANPQRAKELAAQAERLKQQGKL